MIRTIHKLFFIWQLEKEEDWINEMASHGYSLTQAFKLCRYDFEETEQNKYKYKTLFLKGFYTSDENTKYLRFLEEMGIEVVCQIGYPGTSCVYTRARAEGYPDGIGLYSDIDSKINYKKVMAFYLLFVVVLTLAVSTMNLFLGFNSEFISPLNAMTGYLTLGLSVAAAVAMIKEFVQISKLKKEREIHE